MLSQWMVTSETGADVVGGRVLTVVAVVAAATVAVDVAAAVVGAVPVELANTEQPDNAAITNKQAIAQVGPATRSRAKGTRILTCGTLTDEHRPLEVSGQGAMG